MCVFKQRTVRVFLSVGNKNIQDVPKNCALVYFNLFANLNEEFYVLTIKRPKYSTTCFKDCENSAIKMIYFIKYSIYHQVAKVLLKKCGSCNPMLFLSAQTNCIHIKST